MHVSLRVGGVYLFINAFTKRHLSQARNSHNHMYSVCLFVCLHVNKCFFRLFACHKCFFRLFVCMYMCLIASDWEHTQTHETFTWRAPVTV